MTTPTLIRCPRVAELVCYYAPEETLRPEGPTPVPALVTRVCGAPAADHFTIAPYDVPYAGDVDLVALTREGPKFIKDVPHARRLMPYDVTGRAYWQRLEDMDEETRYRTACREVVWRHPDYPVRVGEPYQWWAAYTLAAHGESRDLFVLRPDLACGWSYESYTQRWMAITPMVAGGEQVGTRVVFFDRGRDLAGVLADLRDHEQREMLVFDPSHNAVALVVAREDDARAYAKPVGVRSPFTYTRVSA